MSLKHVFLPLLGVFAASPALAAGHRPVPAYSFLNYHAATVRELTQEVTLDPSVRRRLARHFGLSPTQMVSYIHKNLILTRLKKAGTYHVACIRPNGTEYWVESHLPAGTPVFISRTTGKPILKLACGNPMVSTLPPGVKKGHDQEAKTPPALVDLAPGTEDAALSPELIGADSELAPQLALEPLSAAPVVQVAGSIESLVTPLASGGKGGFPLGFLAGIPLLAGLLSHSGGSSSPNTPVLPPAPVPEASTVVSFSLLTLGGAGLMLSRRRKTVTA